MVLNKELQDVLFTIIPDFDLCVRIINFKDKIEKEETLEYYINRHNNIFNKYNNAIKRDNLLDKKYYSYILDNKYIVSEKDRDIDFYKETGISYQVRRILMDVLNCPTTDADLITDDFTDEDLRKENDKIFYLLTSAIINEMS